MKNYTHLSKNEREQIFLLLNQGNSLRRISRIMGRCHRTIGRELMRNKSKGCTISPIDYSPSHAHSLSVRRRDESKKRKLDDGALRDFVAKSLVKGWSPEQISGRLKLVAPKHYVSAESIYKFVYSKKERGFRYWEFLRRAHKRRQSLYSRKTQSSKRLVIPSRTPIEQRSEKANGRLEVGHLESDLMEGRKTTKDVVSVTTDRKSLVVYLDKLPNKESKSRIHTLSFRLAKLPSILKKTVTFDNGKENYFHELITAINGTKTYFCRPYHSWEKGTVENTIGLIRQYIPKKADLSKVNQSYLNLIARELNTRPRKKLGFYTPQEVVYKEVGWVTSN